MSAIVALKQDLALRSKEYAKILPRHVPLERFTRSVVIACAKTPALLDCNRSSLFLAVQQACQLGLDCSGTLGSAYLIPFKGQVQLIPGYRGLIDLAKRSGQVKNVYAHAVYENDEFEITLGTHGDVKHKPYTKGDRGDLVSVYAVAMLEDGIQFDFMTKSDVDRIKGRSRAGGSGPWTSDFAEMAKKTVVRRLFKYLPVSTDLATALEIEDRVEDGSSGPEVLDVAETPAPAQFDVDVDVEVVAPTLQPAPENPTETFAERLKRKGAIK